MTKIDQYIPGELIQLSTSRNPVLKPYISIFLYCTICVYCSICCIVGVYSLIMSLSIFAISCLLIFLLRVVFYSIKGFSAEHPIVFFKANKTLTLTIFNQYHKKLEEYSFLCEEVKDIVIIDKLENTIKINFTFDKNETFTLKTKVAIQDVNTRDKILDFVQRLSDIMQMEYEIEKHDPRFFHAHLKKLVSLEKKVSVLPLDSTLSELYAKNAHIQNEPRKIIKKKWKPSLDQFVGSIFSYIPGKELIIKYDSALALFLIYLIVCTFPFFILGFLLYSILRIKLLLYYSFILGVVVGLFHSFKAKKKNFFQPEIWNFNFAEKKLELIMANFYKVLDLNQVSEVCLYVTGYTGGNSDSVNIEEGGEYCTQIVLKGIKEYPFLPICDLSPGACHPKDAYDNGAYFAFVFCNSLQLPLEEVKVNSQDYENLKKSVFTREELCEKRKLSVEEKIDHFAFSLVKGPFSQISKS